MRHAVAQHRGNKWDPVGKMKSSRVATRPALAIAEWECSATPTTWGNYTPASDGDVWLWVIQQRLLGESGRRGRQGRMGRLRGQEKNPTERQVGELISGSWALRVGIAPVESRKRDRSMKKERCPK